MLCPQCFNKTLKIDCIGYSMPTHYEIKCETCGYEFSDSGEQIKVLSLEEHIQKRPELYIGHENPDFDKLAREVISKRDQK